MLEYLPEKRATAAAMLSHPWLEGGASPATSGAANSGGGVTPADGGGHKRSGDVRHHRSNQQEEGQRDSAKRSRYVLWFHFCKAPPTPSAKPLAGRSGEIQ